MGHYRIFNLIPKTPKPENCLTGFMKHTSSDRKRTCSESVRTKQSKFEELLKSYPVHFVLPGHFHSTKTVLMLPKEKIGPLKMLMEISIWLNCIFKQCFRLLAKNGKKHQDKCSTMVAIVSWLHDDQVLANHLMLLMSKFDLFLLHWHDITEVDLMWPFMT